MMESSPSPRFSVARDDTAAVGDNPQGNYRQHTLRDFWNEYSRNAMWADRSLLIFTPDSWLRKLCISLTHANEWRIIVNLMILANCVSMVLVDPLGQNVELNQLLETVEFGFTVAFTVELLLQIVATGTLMADPNEGLEVDVFFRSWHDIWHSISCRPPVSKMVILQPAYLLVGWNRLDAVIVAGSWIAILVEGNSGPASILRLLRTLKPLRTMRSLPGLRMLIAVCFEASEQQAAVFLLLLLFMMYVAAPLLPLWAGQLTHRCVNADAPDLQAAAVAIARAGAGDPFERLCGIGARECDIGESCVNSGVSPKFGMRQFDNAASALLLLLQVATMDQWSFAMYQIQDGVGTFAFVPIVCFAIVSAFGVLLLALMTIVVTVSVQLKEHDAITRELAHAAEDDAQLVQSNEGSPSGSPFTNSPILAPVCDVEMGRNSPVLRGGLGGNSPFSSSPLVQRGQGSPGLRVGEKARETGRDSPILRDALGSRCSVGAPFIRPSPPSTGRNSRFSDASVDATDDEVSPKTPRARWPAAASKSEPGSVRWSSRMRKARQLGVYHLLRLVLWEHPKEQLGIAREYTRQTLRECRRTYPLRGPPQDGTPWRRVRHVLFRLISHPRKPVSEEQLTRVLTHQLEEERHRTSFFDAFFLILIIASSVMLAFYTYDMPYVEEARLDAINTAFTVLFITEVAVKFIALGPSTWACDPFNLFDFVVVVGSLPEILITEGAVSLNVLRLLRLPRLLRSVKVLARVPSVRVLLKGLQAGAKETLSYVLLFGLFQFIVTLSGMTLFGGQFFFSGDASSNATYVDANFDNFGRASLTGLQIITGSEWASVMFNGIRAIGVGAVAFFVPVVLLGKYFLMQLLTAIFIARLPEQNYLDREEQSRIKRKRHMQELKGALELEVSKRIARNQRNVDRPAGRVEELSRHRVGGNADSLRFSATDLVSPADAASGMGARHWFVIIAGNIVTWRSRRFQGISFDNIILGLVLYSMLCISLETYPEWPPAVDIVLRISDYTLTTCFVIELALQITHQNRAWPHDGWNWLDAIIVISALISYIPFAAMAATPDVSAAAVINASLLADGAAQGATGSQLAAAKGIRTLRVLRPLRTIKRFPHLKSTVTTLLLSLPATAGVLAITLFVWFILSILGMQLLGGALTECSDGLTPVNMCESAGLTLLPAVYNFNTVGNSLISLLALFKLDSWPSQLWLAATKAKAESGEIAELGVVMYFIAFIFFGSIIVTSLYLAILVNQYQESHDNFMTEEQQRWFEVQKLKARRDDIASVRRAISAAFASGNVSALTPSGAPAKERTLGRQTSRQRLTRNLVTALERGQTNGLSFWARLRKARNERLVKPSKREDNEQAMEDGENNAALLLQDMCWRIAQSQPPHQLLETGMCGMLTLNWVFALLLHAEQPTALTSSQTVLNVITVASMCIEAWMKAGAYGMLGYVSSRGDALDLGMAIIGVAGLVIAVIMPSLSANVSEFLSHSPSLFAMYRVPRLLINWRFFRRPLYAPPLHTTDHRGMLRILSLAQPRSPKIEISPHTLIQYEQTHIRTPQTHTHPYRQTHPSSPLHPQLHTPSLRTTPHRSPLHTPHRPRPPARPPVHATRAAVTRCHV